MSRKIFVIFTISIVVLAFSSNSYGAQLLEGYWESLMDEDNQLEDSVIGIGVITSTQEYTGKDQNVKPVPLIITKYKRLFINGDKVGVFLFEDPEFDLSLVAEPRLWGYDSSETDELTGMEDREWSLDAGLKVSWDNELFKLNITGLADTLGEYDGQEVKAVFSRELFRGFLTPRAGARWFSENLVDHYYGVRASESRPGRPAYEGNATINYLAGITMAIPLGEKWAIIGDFEYEVLGSEIEDSPITDRDETYSYMTGLVYRF